MINFLFTHINKNLLYARHYFLHYIDCNNLRVLSSYKASDKTFEEMGEHTLNENCKIFIAQLLF